MNKLTSGEKIVYAGAFAAAILLTAAALVQIIPLHLLWWIGMITLLNIYLLRRKLR